MTLGKTKRSHRFQDLTGRVFGMLTVLSFSHIHAGKRTMWLCRCECGNEKPVAAIELKNGDSKSCGCLRKKMVAASSTTHGACAFRNRTKEYRIWCNVKTRTGNPKGTGFTNYGGRGIKMCERWANSFENFLADMGDCPVGMSIERKDVNGDYEPENCRWATQKEQMNNQRKNRIIELSPFRDTLQSWSDAIGIRAVTIAYRIKSGWSVREALFTRPKYLNP